MSLPGDLVERLEAALLDAFPDDDALDQLLRRVGMQARVPARAALATRVGKLVDLVDAQRRVLDLLDAARDIAPGNASLAQVERLLLAIADGVDYLGDPLAREVLDVLRRLGLDGPALDALALQLPPTLREILPTSRNRLVRLDETLGLLRVTVPLADGSTPLARWLAAMPARGPDRDVLDRAIDQVHRATQVASQTASSAPPAISASVTAPVIRRVPPPPAYLNAEVQALGELARARARKQALRDAGITTEDLDREILQLRRQLREAGQLRAGDALGDGRYLLIKPVGRGGFAVVWEAFDRTEQRRVAIKVLHSHLAADPQRRERFFRGARVMMELRHPAVVRVYDPRGEEDAFCYFVMELVSGGNLRDAVLSQHIEASRRLLLVLQVGEALAEAHRKRLVHRDVKPGNILLDEHGNAKLTDFDLVGAHDTTGGTRTGALGTVVYAAPECLDKPQEATARADVFGLGMTAIFCLFGQDLSIDTFRDPVVTVAELDCSAAVGNVLKRAVAWKPDRRFGDSAAMVNALRDALNESEQIESADDGRAASSAAAKQPAIADAAAPEEDARLRPYSYDSPTALAGTRSGLADSSNQLALAASQAAGSSLDERVRAALNAGDVRAATTLVLRELGPEVLAFLSGVLGDDDGDEVFARLSERLWRSLAGFQGRCSLRTWTYILARHEIGRYRRGTRKHADGRVPISELEDVLEDVPSRFRTTLVAERLGALAKLRDELPVDDRTLLILRVDRELSWEDIALAFAPDPERFSDEDRKRESVRLRKRFQLIEQRLVTRAREFTAE
jgi:RNA polymerase sigma factor (sigma-70 family)